MRGYDVLVIGADQRQGLAVIRGLGAEGVRVLAAGPRGSIGFYSRHASGRCTYPSPGQDKKAFVDSILEVVAEHRIPLVLPALESTVIVLDEYRHAFPPEVTLAMPSSEALEIALDKRRSQSLAERLGIPTPRACAPASIEEAKAFAAEVGMPVVMKPFASALYSKAGYGGPSFKVSYAKEPASLERELERYQAAGGLPLVQEYIEGIGMAQGVACVDGNTLGIYQYCRAREYPLTGGVTAVHVTEPVEPRVREWTQALVREMRLDGLVQVEYRRSREDGRTVMLEVNGRCWAPISGALRAGLNFPIAYYRHLQSREPVRWPERYPVGQRCRYLGGDLMALEHYFRGHTLRDLNGLPGTGRIVWEMLRDFGPGGTRGDIHRWADPLPSLAEAGLLLGHYGRLMAAVLWRRVRGRGRSVRSNRSRHREKLPERPSRRAPDGGNGHGR